MGLQEAQFMLALAVPEATGATTPTPGLLPNLKAGAVAGCKSEITVLSVGGGPSVQKP